MCYIQIYTVDELFMEILMHPIITWDMNQNHFDRENLLFMVLVECPVIQPKPALVI